MTSSAVSPRQASSAETTASIELERLLRDDAIESVYQPIVELDSGDVVAYEALARGPQDSELHTPAALFGTAARDGRLVELDWACRAAAMRGALGTALSAPTALFVNIEPVASAARIPDQFADVVDGAKNELLVVFELTERALAARPAEVLGAVRHLRALGASIALDDVGVDPRSLALMPFVQPEIIKLDLRLVQGPVTSESARTMHAVNAYAEYSGALVLAEGIETAAHLARARALGAHYGQGWLFGRPGPAPTRQPEGETLPDMTQIAHSTAASDTPYGAVASAGVITRVADKRLILALSRQLEAHAETLGPEAVVVSNVQHLHRFTAKTRERYSTMARQAAFVGVIGEEVGAEPSPGVRGGPLRDGERLTREWTVCVVAPHFSAAMVATEIDDPTRDDMDRRFSYALTYDRNTVVRAARLVMARIVPSDDEG